MFSIKELSLLLFPRPFPRHVYEGRDYPKLEIYKDNPLITDKERAIIAKCDLVRCTAYVHPNAIGTKYFEPICEYLATVFILNDFLDSVGYEFGIGPVVAQIRSGVATDKFGILFLGFMKVLDSEQFKEDVCEYLMSNIIPEHETMEQYIERRVLNTATYSFFSIAKMIDDTIDITNMQSNTVYRNINVIIAITNDCISYAKEVDYPTQSTVKIYMRDHSCDAATAMVEMHKWAS